MLSAPVLLCNTLSEVKRLLYDKRTEANRLLCNKLSEAKGC
jgi:hypothetical protein